MKGLVRDDPNQLARFVPPGAAVSYTLLTALAGHLLGGGAFLRVKWAADLSLL